MADQAPGNPFAGPPQGGRPPGRRPPTAQASGGRGNTGGRPPPRTGGTRNSGGANTGQGGNRPPNAGRSVSPKYPKAKGKAKIRPRHPNANAQQRPPPPPNAFEQGYRPEGAPDMAEVQAHIDASHASAVSGNPGVHLQPRPQFPRGPHFNTPQPPPRPSAYLPPGQDGNFGGGPGNFDGHGGGWRAPAPSAHGRGGSPNRNQERGKVGGLNLMKANPKMRPPRGTARPKSPVPTGPSRGPPVLTPNPQFRARGNMGGDGGSSAASSGGAGGNAGMRGSGWPGRSRPGHPGGGPSVHTGGGSSSAAAAAAPGDPEALPVNPFPQPPPPIFTAAGSVDDMQLEPSPVGTGEETNPALFPTELQNGQPGPSAQEDPIAPGLSAQEQPSGVGSSSSGASHSAWPGLISQDPAVGPGAASAAAGGFNMAGPRYMGGTGGSAPSASFNLASQGLLEGSGGASASGGGIGQTGPGPSLGGGGGSPVPTGGGLTGPGHVGGGGGVSAGVSRGTSSGSTSLFRQQNRLPPLISSRVAAQMSSSCPRVWREEMRLSDEAANQKAEEFGLKLMQADFENFEKDRSWDAAMGIPLPELIPEHGNRTKRVPPRLPETPQGIRKPHHSQKNPVVKDEAREPQVRGGDVEVVRAMISEHEWLEGLGLPKPVPAHPLEKKRNAGIQKEWCMSRFTRAVGADLMGMREDQEPDTQRPVRSLNWCRITIDWMLRHVLDYDQYKEPEFTFERDQTYEDIYGYLRDRMRACLQDMKRQSGSFTSRAAQECREIALRFAILSDEFLCFTNSEAKNRKQTIDRIFEAVSALKDMYAKTERHFEANPHDDRTNPLMWESPFQAEMFSYFIILSCSSVVSWMDNYQRVPERLRNHPRIIFANLACRAVLTQNFALFMRLLKATDVLTACCMGVVAANVRFKFLNWLTRAGSNNLHKELRITLSKLTEVLYLDHNSHVLEFLKKAKEMEHIDAVEFLSLPHVHEGAKSMVDFEQMNMDDSNRYKTRVALKAGTIGAKNRDIKKGERYPSRWIRRLLLENEQSRLELVDPDPEVPVKVPDRPIVRTMLALASPPALADRPRVQLPPIPPPVVPKISQLPPVPPKARPEEQPSRPPAPFFPPIRPKPESQPKPDQASGSAPAAAPPDSVGVFQPKNPQPTPLFRPPPKVEVGEQPTSPPSIFQPRPPQPRPVFQPEQPRVNRADSGVVDAGTKRFPLLKIDTSVVNGGLPSRRVSTEQQPRQQSSSVSVSAAGGLSFPFAHIPLDDERRALMEGGEGSEEAEEEPVTDLWFEDEEELGEYVEPPATPLKEVSRKTHQDAPTAETPVGERTLLGAKQTGREDESMGVGDERESEGEEEEVRRLGGGPIPKRHRPPSAEACLVQEAAAEGEKRDEAAKKSKNEDERGKEGAMEEEDDYDSYHVDYVDDEAPVVRWGRGGIPSFGVASGHLRVEEDMEAIVKQRVKEALDSQMGRIFAGKFAKYNTLKKAFSFTDNLPCPDASREKAEAFWRGKLIPQPTRGQLVNAFNRGLLGFEYGLVFYFPEDTMHKELQTLAGPPPVGQVCPVELERDRVARWMERFKAAFAPEPLAAVSWLRQNRRGQGGAKADDEVEKRLQGLVPSRSYAHPFVPSHVALCFPPNLSNFGWRPSAKGKSLDVYGFEKLPLSLRVTVVEERNHVWMDTGDVLVEDGVTAEEEGGEAWEHTGAAAASSPSQFGSSDPRSQPPQLPCDLPPASFREFALDHAGTTACVFALPLPVRRGDKIELVADGRVLCRGDVGMRDGGGMGDDSTEPEEEPEDNPVSMVLSFLAGNILEALVAIAVGREMEEFGVEPGERGWHGQRRRVVRRGIPPQIVLLFFEDVDDAEHAGKADKRDEKERSEWNMKNPNFWSERPESKLESEVAEMMKNALERAVKLLYRDSVGSDGRLVGKTEFISTSIDYVTALKVANVGRVSEAGVRLCMPPAEVPVETETAAAAAAASGVEGSNGAGGGGAQQEDAPLGSAPDFFSYIPRGWPFNLEHLKKNDGPGEGGEALAVSQQSRSPPPSAQVVRRSFPGLPAYPSVPISPLGEAREASEEEIAERETRQDAEAVQSGVDALISVLRERVEDLIVCEEFPFVFSWPQHLCVEPLVQQAIHCGLSWKWRRLEAEFEKERGELLRSEKVNDRARMTFIPSALEKYTPDGESSRGEMREDISGFPDLSAEGAEEAYYEQFNRLRAQEGPSAMRQGDV